MGQASTRPSRNLPCATNTNNVGCVNPSSPILATFTPQKAAARLSVPAEVRSSHDCRTNTSLCGHCGVPFKVGLASHGYTLAAKCTPAYFAAQLLHEGTIYNALNPPKGFMCQSIWGVSLSHSLTITKASRNLLISCFSALEERQYTDT